MRKFAIEVASYNKTQQVGSNCNAITFINPIGSGADFTVNDVPVTQGSELEISGWQNEIDTTLYVVSFGTGTGICIVVKKVYQ